MNSLLIEARLDDIKSEFRLITAAGRALPVQLSPKVLSVGVEGAFYRYPVTAELKASPLDFRKTVQRVRISIR
jgi:hypothetical protein